jgi:hypothetical protein
VGIDLEAENCELAERRCRGHLGMLAEVEICGEGAVEKLSILIPAK